MGYPMSKNVTDLLDTRDAETPFILDDLAQQLAEQFGQNSLTAKSLLSRATGNLLPGTLCRHLFDCIVHDSAVRDVLTTGHLAKLLSRFDILQRTSDPRVVGLTNPLFDERSQVERAEFFRSGNLLFLDASFLETKAVRELLDREEKLLY